ncbi:uncharacterized protein LOC124154085 [Ischnura elegans]|uniref:uncharacterized protein LOC124154085 n=1 Tax=Ischnura elegans TaxID=197161 RepID=UPI001ED87AC5|nr:uncharacterized protein LOC124154085 [Ischnura elegans]
MVCCAAYGCSNCPGKKIPGLTFHRFPKNPERRAAWTKAVRRKNWAPSKSSVLCSEHFLPEDMDRTSLCNVRIRENAVPSVFPGHPPRLQNPRARNLKMVRSAVHKSSSGNSTSTSDALPEPLLSSVKCEIEWEAAAPQNCPRDEDDDSNGTSAISDAVSPSPCVSMFSERHLMEPSVFEMLLVDENILPLPATWARIIPFFGPKVIVYTQLITINKENVIKPVIYKEVCVLESGCVTCSVIGCQLKKELFRLPEGPLESCKQLENILVRLDALEVCEGITERGSVESERKVCYLDCMGKWRHKNCLIARAADLTCAVCYSVINSRYSKHLRW